MKTATKIDGKKIRYAHPRMPKPEPEIGTNAKAVKAAAEKQASSTDSNKSRAIRRQLVRSAQHLKKSVDYLFTLRKSARKVNKLDDMQYLTEAIANQKQAYAYLDKVSKHHFQKPLDQLIASYK